MRIVIFHCQIHVAQHADINYQLCKNPDIDPIAKYRPCQLGTQLLQKSNFAARMDILSSKLMFCVPQANLSILYFPHLAELVMIELSLL